jgi:hypothetical protein
VVGATDATISGTRHGVDVNAVSFPDLVRRVARRKVLVGREVI